MTGSQQCEPFAFGLLCLTEASPSGYTYARPSWADCRGNA